jgi:hypothetical protein
MRQGRDGPEGLLRPADEARVAMTVEIKRCAI